MIQVVGWRTPLAGPVEPGAVVEPGAEVAGRTPCVPWVWERVVLELLVVTALGGSSPAPLGKITPKSTTRPANTNNHVNGLGRRGSSLNGPPGGNPIERVRGSGLRAGAATSSSTMTMRSPRS